MKFKNNDDQFEWEVLNLTDKDYIKKIKIFSPFNQPSNDLFDYILAREKWNESTYNKKFKKRLNISINILENENYTFENIINIFIALSSIQTHLFIELEYYESSKQVLKEFLRVIEIFLNTFNIINNNYKEIILNPEKLNNYKEELLRLFEYFGDY